MLTARKLPSGSWRCQVYSHTEELLLEDGSVRKKRIYKSFTCDINGSTEKRTCERMAAEWAATKKDRSTISISFGTAMDEYICSRE